MIHSIFAFSAGAAAPSFTTIVFSELLPRATPQNFYGPERAELCCFMHLSQLHS